LSMKSSSSLSARWHSPDTSSLTCVYVRVCVCVYVYV
jgi:hypothetical protein